MRRASSVRRWTSRRRAARIARSCSVLSRMSRMGATGARRLATTCAKHLNSRPVRARTSLSRRSKRYGAPSPCSVIHKRRRKMHSRFFRRLGVVLLGCLVGAEVFGCAQSRDPINRVQANALDKHFFVGPNLSNPSDDPEFYMGHRIIDEPYGVGQDFSLYQSMGSLARIKWEIQEDKLVARLTYERIQNSDYHGSRATDNGQVVAEFKIESHFDIKRDYNPQTGEQLNLIVENTTDRPWYERESFRVDWSTNLVTDAYDFDILAVGTSIDGVKYDPLSYYVEDPKDPDAPVFSNDEGYFDITTKLFATPQPVTTPYGTFPACFLFNADPAITCNP